MSIATAASPEMIQLMAARIRDALGAADHGGKTIALGQIDDFVNLYDGSELEIRVGAQKTNNFASGLPIPTSRVINDTIILVWQRADRHLNHIIQTLNAICANADGPIVARRAGWDVLVSTIDHSYLMDHHHRTPKEKDATAAVVQIGKLRSAKRHHTSPWCVNLQKLQRRYISTGAVMTPLYGFMQVAIEDVAQKMRIMMQQGIDSALVTLHAHTLRHDEAVGKTVEKSVSNSCYLVRTDHRDDGEMCGDLRISLSKEMPCAVDLVPNRLVRTATEHLLSITLPSSPLDHSTSPKQKRKNTATATAAARKKSVAAAAAAAAATLEMAPSLPTSTASLMPRAIVAVRTGGRETRLRVRKSWLLAEQYQIALGPPNGETQQQHVNVVRPSWVVDLTLAWHGQNDAQCAGKARLFYLFAKTALPHDSPILDALNTYFNKEYDGRRAPVALTPGESLEAEWCVPSVELEVECADVRFCHALDAVWPGQLNNMLAKGIGLSTVLAYQDYGGDTTTTTTPPVDHSLFKLII